MSKITDMILSAVLKKGILYEAKSVDTDIEIPMTLKNAEGEPKDGTVKIKFKCENMTLRIEKE